jgi:hypothetical protein
MKIFILLIGSVEANFREISGTKTSDWEVENEIPAM